MSRLIYADALIEKAHHEAQGMSKPFKDQFGVLVEWLVEKMPIIEPEQRWIPCSEKAHPDLPIRVQVQLDNGWIITAYYQNDEWMSVPDCGTQLDDDEIEAWRELPEPYDREGENK